MIAERAEIKNGKVKCPKVGQVPCDKKGRKQVTCVEKGQEASCPITDIKIVTKKKKAQKLLRKGYTLADG